MVPKSSNPNQGIIHQLNFNFFFCQNKNSILFFKINILNLTIIYIEHYICCILQAIQERHENSLLKTEIEKLREKNKSLRETINKACCPNCGVPTTNRDGAMPTEEQQLRIENVKLKAEVKYFYN